MTMTISTEVLVLGAGPAGIAAATAAAEHGRKVIILDDNRKPGGQIWRESSTTQTPPRDSKKQRALDRLHRSGAKLLAGRTVFSASTSGLVEALQETAARTATGIPYLSLSDRDMLACQMALPYGERRIERIRYLEQRLQ